MLGDAPEDVTQVGFRVEPVEFRGADQRVGVGCALAAGVGAGKEIVFAVMRRFS